MTQGFDEYWNKENVRFDDLTKFLIHDAYKAGAASRQAEIDGLNTLNEMSEQKIDDLVLRNIELQKRIDFLERVDNGLKALKILKGESNE